MTQEVLTIRQVADLLQVSPDTVYGLAASGELRGRKIGRIWRFPRDAVMEYVKAWSQPAPRIETKRMALRNGCVMGPSNDRTREGPNR